MEVEEDFEDAAEESEDEEDDEDEGEQEAESDEDLAGIIDGEEWVDEMSGMTDAELREYRAALRPVRTMLTKLRRLACAIKNSSTILLPAWKQQLALLNQPTLMLRRDVKCRWNSTFDMLKRALRLKTAIKSFCVPDHDFHTTDLEEYRLSKREWVIAEQLVEVLKLTDSTEAYRIAMVLHPSFKLEYFKTHHWQDNWIETAKGLVRDEYDLNYKRDTPDATAMDEDIDEVDLLRRQAGRNDAMVRAV
ncbi:uncharacterized protein BXZ73DRAFT_53702 [Epithele typhae]|uniref:uncharacterized protein n=1 Tax=Epithele typhae TaxID=378194 RepID=UPI0020077001|nr:uncharacterized protein BXZ73DRAFT_53702 [Epithele typhae]KAH9916620.1 hypothetical protein BXZ73DRAFT_53702 [Epithele typhae]